MSTLNNVLECVVNVVDIKNAVTSSDTAELNLSVYGIDSVTFDSDSEETYDLMYLDGRDRVLSDPFRFETIIVNGYRDKINRLPAVIVGQFKSKGYKEFDFDNANLMVFTKNQDLISALSRRPFRYKKKEEYKKVDHQEGSFNYKYTPPRHYTHKYTPL